MGKIKTMIGLYITLGVLAFLAVLFLVAAYFAYRKIFFSDRRKKRDAYAGIDKRGFKPYTERIRSLIDNFSSVPFERVYITSRDGLRLSARYYHSREGAPLEIQVHGYRGNPLRDCVGSGIEGLKIGHNLLLIDQRANGESEGKTITFGIKERFDVIDWINYSVERFGSETKILLTGVSMGAATVLMAAGEGLPKNVRGVWADCPFSSPIDIITDVGSRGRIPKFAVRALAISGAAIFGRFAIRSCDAVSAVKRTDVPILLIHGDADTFVPFSMSEEIYNSNPNIIFKGFEGAEHATSYLSHTESYVETLNSFKTTVLED